GVAPGPVDRAVPQRDRDLPRAGRAPALGGPRLLTLGLVHRRTHRVEETGAGVRGGDREDVECVELLAVCRELLDTEPGPAQQPEGVEGRRALLDTSRLLRHRPSSFLASPVAPVPAGRPLQA